MGNEAKFTPGPYVVCNGTDVFTPERDGYQLADCNVDLRDVDMPYEKRKATAVLFSAAPELLAACQEAIRVWEQGCVDRGYKDEHNWIDKAKDLLDDAVAKALGQPTEAAYASSINASAPDPEFPSTRSDSAATA